MKLYIAGVYTANLNHSGNLYKRLTPEEKEARDGVEHYLESYHYIGKETKVGQIREEGTRIFLDSGAYSAFTQGVEIDLPGYVDYIKRNKDIIQNIDGNLMASVLDGIGDPLKTYRNQEAMESLGVRPLPCFHYNEDEKYLEYYMTKYDYITIGGMVPINTEQLIYWLDRIWNRHLCDGSGRPKIKIHGFGVTRETLMKRYPWYSVDSSSWVQSSGNGGIMIPNFGTIFISEHSPTAKKAGFHLNTIPAIQRAAVVQEIQKHGFSVERLQTEYLSRWTFNLWAYTEIGHQMLKADNTFKRPQIGLFE